MLRRALSKAELVEGHCAVDSDHLVREAARSGQPIATLFLSESRVPRAAELLADVTAEETIVVPDAVFASAVSTEAPQGIAALVRAPEWEAEAILREQRALVMVAAALQDPGNFGTLVRSAEAFGASAVVTTSGTVSLWNPKTLRASAGSALRLPVLSMGALPQEALAELKAYGFAIYAADSHHGEIAPAVDLRRKVALVIGNEGAGVPKPAAEACDGFLRIPHLQAVESLNAGVAASLLLYEAFRQRHYRDSH
jgi:TrmH family RNA methyltransferase